MIGELRSIQSKSGQERKYAILEMIGLGNYKLDEASIEMMRDICRPRQKYTSEARNDLSLEDIEAIVSLDIYYLERRLDLLPDVAHYATPTISLAMFSDYHLYMESQLVHMVFDRAASALLSMYDYIEEIEMDHGIVNLRYDGVYVSPGELNQSTDPPGKNHIHTLERITACFERYPPYEMYESEIFNASIKLIKE